MKLDIISKKPAIQKFSTPLLFIHGAWMNAECWNQNFLGYFSELGYEVHALNLRGHGKSGGREKLRWTQIHSFVDDLDSAIATLGSPPALIGHSMGGLIVQRYLETNNLPASVLLSSVPVGGVLATTLRIAARHPGVFLKANITASLWHLVGTPSLARENFYAEESSDEKIAKYMEEMQDETYLGFLQMIFRLPRPKLVKTPLLVLGGEEDTIFLPSEVHATAKAYGVEAEIFPGMPHGIMLEPGWEKVAQRIATWLPGQLSKGL